MYAGNGRGAAPNESPIDVVGCLRNFAVMIAVSRMTTPPPGNAQRLVESIRVPGGEHESQAHFDESVAEADSP